MVTDTDKGKEMADKKVDDFWEKNDDDFWNKPVTTGDWLNSGGGEEKEPKPQNPYGETVDPYRSAPKEPVYGMPKKNFPIFLCINLFLFLLSLIVVSVSILATGQFLSNADYRNRQLDYERILVEEESFPVYDNNLVTLGREACIIFGQNAEKQLLGMPEGEVLIAVPVQVKSNEYKSGQFALKDMFIGCDLGEQRTFRCCIREETILAALAMMGFLREEMLSAYGFGNGNDQNGFFFFFVPEGTREITFYAEERKTEKKLSILVRRYEKNLIISDRKDIGTWLEEIRESGGWQ